MERGTEGAGALDVAIAGGQGGGVGLCVVDCARDRPPGAQKNTLKPWLHKQWCLPEVSGEFVAAMEDVLDLSAAPSDPQRPMVTFAETSKQVSGETRPPLPTQPGQPARYDSEYKRNGTRNIFLFCEPQAGWRPVAVTAQRPKEDFAHQLKWLGEEPY